MTRTWRLAAGGLLLAATVAGIGVLGATSAQAASCVGVTISQGQGLTFDVSSALVERGGCVRFANLTGVTVTVTVAGSSFREQIPPQTPASATAAFTPTRSTTSTATDGVRTGHGDITVEAPPPTPTQAPSTYYPPPVESLEPTYSIPPPSQPSAPPPAVSQSNPALALPPPTLPGGGGSPPTASHPVVAPLTRQVGPIRTATVLDPVGGSGRGLPAAVAAVLLLGVAAAYGRTVLAAAPAVDGRPVPRPVRP